MQTENTMENSNEISENQTEKKYNYNTEKKIWNWNHLPPAFTSEEELKLLRQYHEYGEPNSNIEDPAIREKFGVKDGDILPLREALIYGNLRLVAKYVNDFKSSFLRSVSSIDPDYDDLLSEGVMALVK